jgi:eukaryotic-like serine/threonine-protein kinase
MPAASPVRSFGRFELRRLLGKSAGTTAWLAFDPRLGREVMLTVPRVQPFDAVALELWGREARKAARLVHPQLAPVLEIGLQDKWPFVVVERQVGMSLAEWLAQNSPPSPLETVGWICQALEGLAFAHESGCSHNDLQLHNLLVNEQGKVHLMGLATAGDMSGVEESRLAGSLGEPTEPPAADPHGLMALRKAGERDVLACGLLLYQLLAGQPPLEQPDTARVISRMAPLGREIVHLPWTTPHTVPPALRAIANRSTASQERLRYLGARTLLRALAGWLQTQSEDNGGPLALLLDRLRTVGHLPAQPGLRAKVDKLIAMEGQHTDAMVTELLQDMALSLELLRQVNSALVRNTQAAGNGAVLTIRRSVALLGVNGVRQAANSLRKWPGPLAEPAAAGLKRLMDRVRLAGYVAQNLRPAGYDPEVVYLITMLQNLGRLMVQYHFPDEAEQIVQLTARPDAAAAAPDAAAGTSAEAPDVAGMSEAAASFAVLGVDLQEVGAAVARHWGLGPELQQMIHRIPRDQRVRSIQSDVDALCKTASAANEVVDAIGLQPPTRAMRALDEIAQRYARALKINLRNVRDAVQSAREMVKNGGVAIVRDTDRPPAAGTPTTEGIQADGVTSGVTSLTPALVTTVGAASFPT